MWFLTCDSDLLGDHPVWLQPGSSHLLGRTTPKGDGDVRYIDHKSVSRKHLVIAVAENNPGDSKHLHVRSKVTVTDASKTGTYINDEKLHQGDKVIERDVVFKLGSSEHIFHIRWRPVVLTFSNLTGSQKKKQDPLEEYRSKLELADIKLFTTFLSETTHVVASGRNNPACLQALALGKWTVRYSFVDVLAKLFTRDDTNKCELEKDFSLWPAEKDYLIPTGSEPVPRPDEMLMPDPKRADTFAGVTVIFMIEKQYDSLVSVVAAAGGKSLLCEVIASQTKASVFVDSITAHFKDTKRQARTDVLKKVIVVRAESKENSEWWATFNNQVDTLMKRKCMAQADFLDAILTRDISSILPNSEGEVTPDEMPVSQKAESTSRSRKFVAQSRFQGFAEFEPSEEPSPAPEVEEMQVDTELPNGNKKRPAAFMSDILDQQLHGMQNMKRQRFTITSVPSKEVTPKPKPKPSKPEVLDVKAKLAEQREREEKEERRLAEEALNNQLDGLTVEDLKKLVQHAEFDVDLNDHRSPGNSTQRGDNWNPAWNGRKNFKAFRRKDQTAQPVRPQRIMVALEPIPAQRNMFSEEYFLESEPTQSRRSKQPIVLADSDDQSSPGLSAPNGSVPTSAQRKRPAPDTQPNGTAKKARTRRVMFDQNDDDDELQFRRKRF